MRAKNLLRRMTAGFKVPEYYWNNHHKKIRIDRELPEFAELAAEIIREKRSYLSYDRLYTLYQAALQVPDNGISIEVGVYHGGASKFIATLLQPRGMKHYACDTFEGHAVVDSRFDGTHQFGDYFTDVALDDVRRYLAPLPNVEIVVGDIQKTFDTLPDTPISLLHCDVDVYPATRFTIENAWPRLMPRSVVVVDDYGFTTCRGARQAIDEFVSDRSDCMVFHLLTGQAILMKS